MVDDTDLLFLHNIRAAASSPVTSSPFSLGQARNMR
jgi:hypothetical protein